MEESVEKGVSQEEYSRHLLEENVRFSKVNTKQVVSIEYPGFVKSIPKMLQTIGGEKNLSDIYFKTKTRLQMTYRPEDLNAHFVHGDLVPCTGVLVKVKRRKKKMPHREVCEYKQEIVAVVKDQYRFQALMDFQYLTPEPLWDYFKEIHGSELGQKNLPPYYAPPVFGRIDSCGSYNYRPDPQLRRPTSISKEMKEAFQIDTRESAGTARKRRQTESMAALYDIDEVPERASENATKIIEKLKGGPETDAIEIIQKLFEDRPIWSKLAISCHVTTSFERLKKILQYFAYYWLSGPWRTMWCRMGYDPRKDRSAKMYQMIDFRIRESKDSRKMYKSLIARRSHKNYIPRNLQSRTSGFGSSVLAASEQPSEKEKNNEAPYIFHPDKMLPSRNMMYQLCDIHDEGVQKIISSRGNQATECNEKEGWFLPETMNKIRKQMAKTVKAYFEKEKNKKKRLIKPEEEHDVNKESDKDESESENENIVEEELHDIQQEQFGAALTCTELTSESSEGYLNLPLYSHKAELAPVVGQNVSYLRTLQSDNVAEEPSLQDDNYEDEDLYYDY